VFMLGFCTPFFVYFIQLGRESDTPGIAKSLTLFMAPKPGFGSTIPSGLRAWQRQLHAVGGDVVLLLNMDDDIRLARRLGFKTEFVVESMNGFPLLDSVLRVATRHNSSKMVAFCNSDIFPGKDFFTFVDVLAKLEVAGWQLRHVDPDFAVKPNDKTSEAWLVVLSRIDFTKNPSDGHVFMDGGVDMWIWNNVEGDNDICAAGIEIPAFSVGRPWFDNWLTAAALQLGGRHVIDGTGAINVYHKKHKRLGSLSDWSDMKRLERDLEWQQNKQLAYEQLCSNNGRCVTHRLGIGTTCEAPLYLDGTVRKLQVRKRDTVTPCPSCTECYAH